MKKCSIKYLFSAMAFLSLVPCAFAADDYWTLNASGARKITDGEWVFSVTVNENAKEIEVTGVTDKNASAHLDLSKPVKTADGTEYALVGVRGNSNWFMGSTVETIEFPETLRRVDKVFVKLPNLTTITPFLPASLDTFNEKSFWSSTALTGDLVIGRDGRPITFINAGSLFQNTKITSAELGVGATNIPARCFSTCTALTNVVVRGKIAALEGSVFSDCTSLTNVTMDTSKISNIGSSAFNDCKVLKGDFVFDSDIESIGDGAFKNCKKVTSLVFNGDVGSVGYEAGIWTTALTNIVFGGTVGDIADRAFITSSNLKTLYFNGKPVSVGSTSFRDISANARLYVSKYNMDWKAFLADTTKVTPWHELTDAQKKVYTDLYPGEATPKGLFVVEAKSSLGFGNKGNLWVLTWIPPGSMRPGFSIIIR